MRRVSDEPEAQGGRDVACVIRSGQHHKMHDVSLPCLNQEVPQVSVNVSSCAPHLAQGRSGDDDAGLPVPLLAQVDDGREGGLDLQYHPTTPHGLMHEDQTKCKEGMKVAKTLSTISWNIEAKGTLDALEDVQCHQWDVLLPQETSKSFSAGGHIVNLKVGSHNASGTTVVIRNRWAKAVREWGGERFPWNILQTDEQMFGVSTIAFMSCHMPCMSNSHSAEKWEEAMFLLYKDFADAKAAADQVVLMGDVNVSSLAEYFTTAGRHLSAEVGRPTDHGTLEQELEASFPARRWGEHLQREEDFVDFMTSHGIRVVVPTHGFVETYVPWNSQVTPRVLDYTIVFGGWHRAAALQLRGEPEWTTTTSHTAQHLTIVPIQVTPERDREDGLMKYVHMRRKRRPRRTWPGWQESTVGQMSASISEAATKQMVDFE